MRISDWSSDVCSSDLRGSMTTPGTKMIREDRTARELFEEVMANPARKKFGFGEKLAIVNVDFQQAYTRIDLFKTAYETDPDQIAYANRISRLARAKGMPVIWSRVGRSEEHTSELQSLMRPSYAGF